LLSVIEQGDVHMLRKNNKFTTSEVKTKDQPTQPNSEGNRRLDYLKNNANKQEETSLAPYRVRKAFFSKEALERLQQATQGDAKAISKHIENISGHLEENERSKKLKLEEKKGHVNQMDGLNNLYYGENKIDEIEYNSGIKNSRDKSLIIDSEVNELNKYAKCLENEKEVKTTQLSRIDRDLKIIDEGIKIHEQIGEIDKSIQDLKASQEAIYNKIIQYRKEGRLKQQENQIRQELSEALQQQQILEKQKESRNKHLDSAYLQLSHLRVEDLDQDLNKLTEAMNKERQDKQAELQDNRKGKAEIDQELKRIQRNFEPQIKDLNWKLNDARMQRDSHYLQIIDKLSHRIQVAETTTMGLQQKGESILNDLNREEKQCKQEIEGKGEKEIEQELKAIQKNFEPQIKDIQEKLSEAVQQEQRLRQELSKTLKQGEEFQIVRDSFHDSAQDSSLLPLMDQFSETQARRKNTAEKLENAIGDMQNKMRVVQEELRSQGKNESDIGKGSEAVWKECELQIIKLNTDLNATQKQEQHLYDTLQQKQRLQFEKGTLQNHLSDLHLFSQMVEIDSKIETVQQERGYIGNMLEQSYEEVKKTQEDFKGKDKNLLFRYLIKINKEFKMQQHIERLQNTIKEEQYLIETRDKLHQIIHRNFPRIYEYANLYRLYTINRSKGHELTKEEIKSAWQPYLEQTTASKLEEDKKASALDQQENSHQKEKNVVKDEIREDEKPQTIDTKINEETLTKDKEALNNNTINWEESTPIHTKQIMTAGEVSNTKTINWNESTPIHTGQLPIVEWESIHKENKQDTQEEDNWSKDESTPINTQVISKVPHTQVKANNPGGESLVSDIPIGS